MNNKEKQMKQPKREFAGCAAWAAIQNPPMSTVQARNWAKSGRVKGVKQVPDRMGFTYLMPMDVILPAEMRKRGARPKKKI